MVKINKYTLIERNRVARTIIRRLDDPLRYTREEFIQAAEQAMKEYPDEWIVFYIAGDYYAQMGRYTDSLRAVKRCVELRPNEIRSAYALASAYNMFTRAEWVDSPEIEAALAEFELITGQVSDPSTAKRELDKAGLLMETAALQAIRWFEKALTLRPDRASREIIGQDLQTLYRRFPHLKR